MATENTESVRLTLDPRLVDEHTDPFAQDENKLSLSQLIPRIVKERGPFVNLTEDALVKEIEQSGSADGDGDHSTNDKENNGNDDDDEDDVYNEGETPVQTNTDFLKNKAEFLKNITVALNESSLSLDFVSLLISCVRPAAGTISMSSHLKKFVPPGSLNSDITTVELSKEEKEKIFREEKIVGQGWKLSSLESASKYLQISSLRLNQEVIKERHFWDTISTNFDNRGMLYKSRDKVTGNRIFVVKYGYEDSGSKVKGNAILKSINNEPYIQVVPADAGSSTARKYLRVRILNKSSRDIIGESKIEEKLDSDNSIKSEIERARFFIFEQELFQQLLDEVTSLIAYDVQLENEDKIVIHLTDEVIELEFVDFEEFEADATAATSDIDQLEYKRAELISAYLRMMLTIKFKCNLESKLQTRVLSISGSTRQQYKSSQLILRPLIGHFKHKQMIGKLYRMVKNLMLDLKDSSLKIKRYSNLSAKDYEENSFKRILTSPISQFILQIGNNLLINIELESIEFVDIVIHVNVLKDNEHRQILNVDFQDLNQLENCLEWVLDTNS